VATCFLGLFLELSERLSQYLQAMETNRSALDQFAGRGGKQTHYLLGVCVLRVCVYECAGSLAFTTNTPRAAVFFFLSRRGGAERARKYKRLSVLCAKCEGEREPLALEAEMKITHLQRAICKAAQRIHTHSLFDVVNFYACTKESQFPRIE
jgi:hypothetical protein